LGIPLSRISITGVDAGTNMVHFAITTPPEASTNGSTLAQWLVNAINSGNLPNSLLKPNTAAVTTPGNSPASSSTSSFPIAIIIGICVGALLLLLIVVAVVVYFVFFRNSGSTGAAGGRYYGMNEAEMYESGYSAVSDKT